MVTKDASSTTGFGHSPPKMKGNSISKPLRLQRICVVCERGACHRHACPSVATPRKSNIKRTQ